MAITEVSPPRSMRMVWAVLGVMIVATAVFAWSRVGILDLPAIPDHTTLESSGLGHLDAQHRLDAFVRNGEGDPAGFNEAARQVRAGIVAIEQGSVEAGLQQMRDGIRTDPKSLVLTNAYRMVTFALKRDALAAARKSLALAPDLPPQLADQPVAFLTALVAESPSRETKLALAMAWVDHMLLHPALEVKAPASVEAVDILTDVIDSGDASYVPALFARGLNHLHRPARLVWPETMRTPRDAAVRDIGRCVAIGRKLDVGSKKLRAMLAIALGDAYVKTAEYGQARSWWQIAQNLSDDKQTQSAIRRRFTWRDEQMIDELENELDRSRSELVNPMTDLAMMWN